MALVVGLLVIVYSVLPIAIGVGLSDLCPVALAIGVSVAAEVLRQPAIAPTRNYEPRQKRSRTCSGGIAERPHLCNCLALCRPIDRANGDCERWMAQVDVRMTAGRRQDVASWQATTEALEICPATF